MLVTSDTAFTALFQAVEDTVGINSSLLTPHFSLYPNPSRGDVTVAVSEPTVITVVDLQGRTVIASTPVASVFLIPRTSLQPGVYFVRVATVGATSVRKLIVD